MTHEPRYGLAGAGDGDIAATARRTEQLGFDYFGVGEHLFFHVPTTNAFVALAAAASVTSRLELISMVTLLPLYPAALVAKLSVALDRVSAGRFNLGVGVGGEYPREFRAVGVPVNERGARATEALELIRRLWTNDHVTFDGRFTTLDDVTLRPQPLRVPPIWVAGRGDAAVDRAARLGDAWVPYFYTPQLVARGVARLRERAEEAGRDPADLRIGVVLFTACQDNREVALRSVASRLERNYHQPFDELVEKYAVAGPPDACAARVAEYQDAGVDTVLFMSACPDEYVEINDRRLAEEVVPLLRGTAAMTASGRSA